MLASGFLRGIDTDKTDGNLLAIGDNGDGVTVGDPGAFELAARTMTGKMSMTMMRKSGLKALVAIRMPSMPYCK